MKIFPNITKLFHFYSSTFIYSTFIIFVVIVQTFSHAQLFATPWTAAWQASIFHVLHRLLELSQTHVH